MVKLGNRELICSLHSLPDFVIGGSASDAALAISKQSLHAREADFGIDPA